MKLVYITNSRLPTEKAHGIQIAKMCKFFARAGVKVELVYPKRKNKISESFFDFYSVKKNFELKKLWSLDFVGVIPKIGFRIQAISFAKTVLLYLFWKKFKGIIYCRDQFSAFLLSLFGFKVVFEIHSLPEKLPFYYRFFISKLDKFVAISSGLKNDLIDLGVFKEKILVAPDGVDLEPFEEINEDKSELRRKLSLPSDKKIALYAGHLYRWKGAHNLALASKFLTENIDVIFIGGTKEDLITFKKFQKENKLSRISILGYKKHSEIPVYLKTADILALPNSGEEKISSRYTSPLKLFEYLASGTAIVASNLPSIREILNEQNSLLVEPDNPEALAGGIKKILADKELAKNISVQGLKDVKKYTWQNRVEKILDFIKY